MESSAIARQQRLLSDADIFRYVAARIVSLSGNAITFIAMPVLVYGITGSATWTSLVVVAEAIPYLLFGLWAGALADHLDRQRVMVTADLTAAAVLATVPVAWWLDTLTATHVLIAAFTARTVFVFFDAANQGALPSLVSRDRLPAANALVFGSTTVAETIVPVAAGALIVVISPASIIAIDAVTFVGSAILIRAIVRPLSATRNGASSLGMSAVVDGARFIAGHDVIRIMVIVGSLVAFSAGSLVAIQVVWADHTLGVREGDWRLGVLFGAWGIGAVIGSAIVSRLMGRFGGARAMLIVLPLAAVSGVSLSLVRSWLPAVVAVTVWAMAFMILATISLSTRQQVTPERLMSRVMTAGRMATFGLGHPIGAFVAGMLAANIEVHSALLICQLSLTAAALLAWLSPLRSAPRALPVVSD